MDGQNTLWDLLTGRGVRPPPTAQQYAGIPPGLLFAYMAQGLGPQQNLPTQEAGAQPMGLGTQTSSWSPA